MMDTEDARRELLRLRGSIDNMDSMLVHLLAERFKITQQVGKLKATAGLPPADPDREAQQIQRLRALAVESELDPEFAEKWFNFSMTPTRPSRQWPVRLIGRSTTSMSCTSKPHGISPLIRSTKPWFVPALAE